ncbi:hypothetical protein ACFWY6_41545 [Streptomyces sp. NPDC059037]|uniref:hypothetical protein n=1 Tax=Streptomyces sp. NPDC059037 TaxID=3346710 RepID=UPI0036BBC6A7
MRKVIGAAVTTVVIAGSLGLAVPASAGDTSTSTRPVAQAAQASAKGGTDAEVQRLRCGGTIKRLSAGPGPLGNKRWDIYYKNCSSSSVKRKVDIKRAGDLPCRKIKAHKTTKWHYETGYFGPDSPRKVKKC